jgi:GxxExxY protein
MIVSGIVIKGKGKGGRLGFPTANIKLEKNLASGVYSGKVYFQDKKYQAGIFIKENILEAYILDFSGDLYGAEIKVELGEMIREARKFNSDEELTKQIREDIVLISRLTQIKTQKDADSNFLYSDITYKIRGACFEVYKQFGGAFKEKIIENALLEELKIRGLKIETQKRIDIYYKDKKVGVYVPDIIVNNSVLVELKCKPFITKEDERQFWLYLKGSNYKLGLLINFGSQKLEIRRRIYDSAREKSA